MSPLSKKKRCTRCKRSLPLEAFGRDVNVPGGLNRWCRECVNRMGREQRRQQNGVPQYDGTLKQCSKCKQWLSKTEFHRNRTRADGLAYHCKECSKQRRRDFKPQYNGQLKRCTGCGNWLPKTEFYCHCGRSDGLSDLCQGCSNAKRQQYKLDNLPQYNGPLKQCSTCGYWFPRTEFHRSKRRRDGLSGTCKECAKKRNQQHYYDHPEMARESSEKWRKSHPEAIHTYNHRRRARKKANGGSFTAEEWQALCAQYDHRCLCCGEQLPLTVDHVIPISKGGSNNLENIQPLCKRCNSSKGVKSTDYRPQPTLEVAICPTHVMAQAI